MFSVNSYVGKRLAHRLSYEDAKGRIPKGGLILHSCDNPACVNPAHLRVGSYKENVSDMDSRGRRNNSPMKGSENPNAFMTDALVTSLRRDYISGMSRAEIAAKYGVSLQSVNDFTLGRSWRHLLGKDGSPSLDDLRVAAQRNKKPNTKLTPEIVIKIRAELSGGATGIELSERYGVHKATISDIKRRKIWADV